jgi:DNA-binding CsgD family transcriptional regulator
VELARRALAGGRLLHEQPPDSPPFFHAVATLGGGEEAWALLRQASDDAVRRGSLLGQAIASSVRAALLRSGSEIRELESEATAALEATRKAQWNVGLPLSVSGLLTAFIEQGRFDNADALLAETDMEGDVPNQAYFTFMLYERGRLRAAQRRPAEAYADFKEVGQREERAGYGLHAVLWRAAAAPELLALGEETAAQALANEALGLSKHRGRRLAGVALRSLALVDTKARVDLLEQAVGVLGRSQSRLELSRVRADYGVALRGAGQRVKARAQLEQALDLAHHCGATAIADLARAELVALGAKPRRDAITGRDALTASELRVARLAAQGMTNREIAQALFITSKTASAHLSHIYRKLEITRRAQLAQALASHAPD